MSCFLGDWRNTRLRARCNVGWDVAHTKSESEQILTLRIYVVRLRPDVRRVRALTHVAALRRGMLNHRSNAFLESMNGQIQQAKRAACGYRTARNFIAIAYLCVSRLKNFPAHPFAAAVAV